MRLLTGVALLYFKLFSYAAALDTSCMSFFEAQENDGHTLAVLADEFYFNIADVDVIDSFVNTSVSSIAVIVEGDTTSDTTVEVYTVDEDVFGIVPYHLTASPPTYWKLVGSTIATAEADCRSIHIDLDSQPTLAPTPRGFYIRAIDSTGAPASVLRGQDGTYPCLGGPQDEVNFDCDRTLASTVALSFNPLPIFAEELVITSFEQSTCYIDPNAGVNACAHGTCSSGVCVCEPGFGGPRCNTIVDRDLVSDVLAKRFIGGVCFNHEGDASGASALIQGSVTTIDESFPPAGVVDCSPTNAPTEEPTLTPTEEPTPEPPCMVTGFKWLDRIWSSIIENYLSAQTWEECQELCQHYSECAGWTFRPSTHKSRPFTCLIFADYNEGVYRESTSEHVSCAGRECVDCSDCTCTR